jgi:acyl-CoA thioesterase FadM
LVEAQARFLIPSKYGDELVAESSVTEWKKSSFVVSHKFLRDGKVVVEGFETHVWAAAHPTNANRMKSVTLPQEVIRKLSATNTRAGARKVRAGRKSTRCSFDFSSSYKSPRRELGEQQ